MVIKWIKNELQCRSSTDVHSTPRYTAMDFDCYGCGMIASIITNIPVNANKYRYGWVQEYIGKPPVACSMLEIEHHKIFVLHTYT